MRSARTRSLHPISWRSLLLPAELESLTDGRICLSRQTFWFSFVRSTQIRSRPLPFGTSTIPAHQSVGPSTLEVTSRSSIRCSSFLTLSRSGRATLLGVVTENAMAPSFRVTLYVPSIQPTPWKRWGNFWTIGSFCVRTGSTCPTRLRDSMAGLLSSGLCRPCTTYALVSQCFRFWASLHTCQLLLECVSQVHRVSCLGVLRDHSELLLLFLWNYCHICSCVNLEFLQAMVEI